MTTHSNTRSSSALALWLAAAVLTLTGVAPSHAQQPAGNAQFPSWTRTHQTSLSPRTTRGAPDPRCHGELQPATATPAPFVSGLAHQGLSKHKPIGVEMIVVGSVTRVQKRKPGSRRGAGGPDLSGARKG